MAERYRKIHRRFKRNLLLVNLISVVLVTAGTIAGGITLNPVILGVISGSGVLLKTLSEFKNYPNKVEKAKFAFTSYEKAWCELRSYLRGEKFDSGTLITKMKVLDEIIIDFSFPRES